jgi:hypothetical protein
MPSKLFDAALCCNAVHLKSPEVHANDERQKLILFGGREELRQEDQSGWQVVALAGPFAASHTNQVNLRVDKASAPNGSPARAKQ